ncbi:CIA30 family protein [Halomonas denitrificans]|nr:CIA30 family protein [Halomonas denitrificans]
MRHPIHNLSILLILIGVAAVAKGEERLLDDFSRNDGRSAFGTSWTGFTDRVMGGRSDLAAGYVVTGTGPALRMRGTVRLDNNGGFVQLRLPLVLGRRPLDASAFDRFVVEARGRPGPYYLHLRTPQTRRPWAYYRARLDIGTDWRRIVVPLSEFDGVSIDRPLDVSRLLSVALVAYGEAFEADLVVRRISLMGPADTPDSDTADGR